MPDQNFTRLTLDRAAEQLTNLTGVKWTVGYIGNVELGRDDRSWFLFAEHPGRVGTSADRIGGYPTDKLGDLAERAVGAVQMARFLVSRNLITR